MREFTDRHLYIFSNRRLKRIRIIRQSMRYINDKDTIQIDMERNRNTVKRIYTEPGILLNIITTMSAVVLKKKWD